MMSDAMRQLTKGSVWLDEKMRTLVLLEIHWANAVNVASFDLLVFPSLKIVNRPASQIEGYVREGIMQYCPPRKEI